MTQINPNHIERICLATDERLWSAYSRSLGQPNESLYNSSLIFPVYRSGEIRVSEQEARFVFAESLASTSYLYSIETPTREDYKFTGSKPISAQTDLTMYNQDQRPLLNVEFKAQGFSEGARSLFSLKKDLQKLLREPVSGLWFHVLKAADNATLSKLLKALSKALFETQLNVGGIMEWQKVKAGIFPMN